MRGGLEPRGPIAAEIEGLWWFMFWLGLAVFVVFAVLLAVGMVKRRRPEGETAAPVEPAPGEDARVVRRWLVGLGVVMTTVVLIVVMVATVASMRAIPNAAGEDALHLDLVAQQFFWEARYPSHGVTSRGVVRIPVGRPVELRLTSLDVIHSFWVPALAGKMDALPEDVNTLVIEADRPGTYRGHCAEFCGLWHAKMQLLVVAMPPAEFDAWLEHAR